MSGGPALRVLVVDDEPLARKRLSDLLDARSEVASVTEARDGDEALAALRRDDYDIVFLDVQMPGKDGLEVLREMGPDAMPVTILVTAFDRFAIAAFELAAIDYLLKPFDDERFDAAWARAVRRVEESGALEALRRGLGGLIASPPARRYAERVALEARGRVHLVSTAAIDWIEAEGNYVNVHAQGERYLSRASLRAVEEQLDPERFFRCHRSFLVNLERVREVQDLLGGRHRLVLAGGERVPLSRRQRRLLPRLGG